MTDRYNATDGFIDGHLSNDALAELSAAHSVATVPTEHRQHVDQCAQCQQALTDVDRVIAALGSPNLVEEPPPGLWDSIAADLGDELDTAITDSTSAPTDRSNQTGASPQQLRPRPESRGAPWWGVFTAAAVGALIGGVGIAAILNQDTSQDDPPVADSVLGAATLEPVAAEDISGTADMVQRDDGSMELTIEISNAPDPAEGYFEVWLRDEEASQLISLGTVTRESTTLEVPAGVDLAEYNVVDVSHEHFDGDPGHSGVTLAAGLMETEDS